MAGATHPVIYVLNGADAYMRRQARQKVLGTFEGDSSAIVSLEGDVDLSTVMDERRTASFLAPHRLVIVENADKFVTSHRDALERYLEAPSSSATLVLVVETFLPASRLGKKASEVGEIIPCSAPKGGELLTCAVRFAHERGKKLLPASAKLLVDYVGADLGKLENEVEKLCLYIGVAGEITPQDVQAASVATAGPGEWDLMNAIRDGRAAEALDLLAKTLTRRGEEFRLMGGLIWEYRRQLAGKAGPPFGGKFSRPSGPASTTSTATKRLPRLAPKQVLRLLLQTDLALKSGADTDLTMQTLVLRLCGGK